MHVMWIIHIILAIFMNLSVNCSGDVTNVVQETELPVAPAEPGFYPLSNIQVTCEQTRLKGLYILKFHWPVIMTQKVDPKPTEEAANGPRSNQDNEKPNGKKDNFHILANVRLFPIEEKKQDLKKVLTRRTPFIIPTYLEQGKKDIHLYI
jgi:hypothetical protein